MKNIITLILAMLILISYPVRLVTALDITITGNGSDTNNEVNIQVENNQNVVQTNTANIDNNIHIDSNTGGNTASENGGEVEIVTGDTSQTVVVENNTNTSLVDTGDCCQNETEITIVGNGNGSTNTTSVFQELNTQVVVNQNTTIKNTIYGNVNTGNNVANQNNGNVNISTGSITVAGGINNGPINIHDVKVNSDKSTSTNMVINENGVNSFNSLNYTNTANDTTYIFNTANILNNVLWDLNTGNNHANGNSGDVSILTGDIDFNFYIDNGPINFGSITIDDCCIIDDPEDPDDPDDFSDPVDPGDPIGGSTNNTHAVQAAVYSVAIDAIEILGLSDTSSNLVNPYIYWMGVIFVGLGLKTVGSSVNKKYKYR
ncbi:hypothetical protein IPM62_04910 [Candidatus Woesebacteria bacterium]|nr:MAG: hypothetical protein IPM62_04910 [Candidatus Woesebacteria bacterium]